MSPTRTTPMGRRTRQRGAIVALLAELDEFRSAQQIHEMLRERGTAIGLTTVYRALASLVDAGEIDALRHEAGDYLYRRCGEAHHHHLVCRECAHTVEVAGPTVERWAAKVAAEHGFSEISHTIELTGVCSQCRIGEPAASTRGE